MTIDYIELQITGGTMMPAEVPNCLTYLAVLYGKKSRELEQVLIIRGTTWLKFRETKTSDLAATMEWEATGKGIREVQLTIELQRIEQLIAALSYRPV